MCRRNLALGGSTLLLVLGAAHGQSYYYTNPRVIQELANAVRTGPALTYDELYMVYAQEGDRTVELFETGRTDPNGKWGGIKRLSAFGKAARDPFISRDGLELYFASQHTANLGSWDIWVSRRKSVTSAWGTASNLGAPINGPQYLNTFPVLTDDGLVMFFCRDVLGKSQIFTARRPTIGGSWGSVQQFMPTASPFYDEFPMPGSNGREIWFGRADLTVPVYNYMHMYFDSRTKTWSKPVVVPEFSGKNAIYTGWNRGVTGRFYGNSGILFVADPITPVSRLDKPVDQLAVIPCGICDLSTWWSRRYGWGLGQQITIPVFYGRKSRSPNTSVLLLGSTALTQPVAIVGMRNQLVVSPANVVVVPFSFTSNLGKVVLTVPKLAVLKGATFWFQNLWLDSSVPRLAAFSEPAQAIVR